MNTVPAPAAPPPRRRRAVIAAVVLLLGAAALAWVWRQRNAATEDPHTLLLYGNVDQRQVSLAFNTAERIAELTVREGDRVNPGQVLGRLDVRTPRLRVAQAEAQIGVAEQVLARLRAGTRPEEIAQARAAAAAAAADAEFAAQQLARLQAARDQTAGRGVAQQDLDGAAAKRKVALAQRDSADKALALAIAGPRREDIRQAEAQLAAARADKALAERQIEESELKAPIASVVRARLLEPGDIASPQRPVFTLAIMQPKWVRAFVPEPRLSQIRPGMAAQVRTDSAPAQPLPGRIGFIASVAEFTPKSVQTEELRTSLVYEVRIEVDDPADTLRLGMPATVRIELP
ncbi:MAG TPA: HlyD family efflux transporter periplasmic adaptor subunit [Rubrivivax sp.]|mgnify:CR=1 FL=1|nr:HlyD family efflux transporter periplasmic adaptor subunit [Rubrivivax sp.]